MWEHGTPESQSYDAYMIFIWPNKCMSGEGKLDCGSDFVTGENANVHTIKTTHSGACYYLEYCPTAERDSTLISWFR